MTVSVLFENLDLACKAVDTKQGDCSKSFMELNEVMLRHCNQYMV